MSARADNADMRLTAKGRNAGVVTDKRWSAFQDEKAQMDELRSILEAHKLSSQSWIQHGLAVRSDSSKRSAFDLLRHANVDMDLMVSVVPELLQYSEHIRSRMQIEGTYAPYIVQQTTAAASFSRDESLLLPPDLDYQAIHGLSWEEKNALGATRPESLGQARRVEGVTPTGALRLLAYVKGERRKETKQRIYKKRSSLGNRGSEAEAVA